MKEKADFPAKKILWPILYSIIECDKTPGTFYKVPEGILTNTLEVIRSFL